MAATTRERELGELLENRSIALIRRDELEIIPPNRPASMHYRGAIGRFAFTGQNLDPSKDGSHRYTQLDRFRQDTGAPEAHNHE